MIFFDALASLNQTQRSMPKQRISMKLIREVLRHYHEKGSSKRRIATDLLLSPGTVRTLSMSRYEGGS